MSSIHKKLKKSFNVFISTPKNFVPKIRSAEESLHTIRGIFEEGKLHYYLIFGTLLAAYREKKLFSYDTDIDMAIFEEDIPLLKSLIPRCIEKGYYISEVCYSCIKINPGNANFVVDLWIIHKNKNPFSKLLGKKWLLDHAPFSKELFIKENTKLTDCYDQTYKIPGKSETLLEMWYGKNWKIPQKNMHADYRAFLSRIITYPFITYPGSFYFSGHDLSCSYRPWASWLIKTFFSKTSLMTLFKHQ